LQYLVVETHSKKLHLQLAGYAAFIAFVLFYENTYPYLKN